MTSTGEISDSFSMSGSKLSRDIVLTPSKPTRPVVIAEFGRQRLKAVPVVPGPGTPAAALVPIVLIVTPPPSIV
ncbi:hypothetical protein D3C87_1162800 [compost metagenome]